MSPRALHVRSADEPRLLVGLMCGTSGDGISAAAVELRGLGFDKRIRLLAHLGPSDHKPDRATCATTGPVDDIGGSRARITCCRRRRGMRDGAGSMVANI
jgi:hypothetical protein